MITPADHPGRRAPRRRPAQLAGALPRRVGDVEGRGEVLLELMARRHLEGLAVAHHHFAGDRVRRAGEPLRPCLDPTQHRHRQAVAQERRVDVLVDRAGEAGGIGFRRVGRVAFLPEELARAKEDPWPELPADDVGPLVEQQRKVPVALDPLGHELAEDRLARRPDDQRLGRSLPPACVTTASSGLNPSTCSASRRRWLSGMSSGK